jgi:hypothetical protein
MHTFVSGTDALTGFQAAYAHLCAVHFIGANLPTAAGADAAMGQVHAAVNLIQPLVGDLFNMLLLVSLVAQPDARIQL